MLVNENGKLTFGKIASKYDLYRPGYPSALLNTLVKETNLTSETDIFESGCGTGQLTKELEKYDPFITAIDISEDMIAIAKEKFKTNSKITFEAQAFEQHVISNHYDLVVAATSFHWLDKETRLKKAHNILNQHGFLALIHNIGKDYECSLYPEFKKVYDSIIPPDIRTIGKNSNNTADELTTEIMESILFDKPNVFTFHHIHTLNADHYIELLDTSSFEHNLPHEIKDELFKRIHNIVLEAGNIIELNYESKLILARKK